MKVLIGTPAYNSLVHIDYMHSILNYTTIKGLYFSVMTLGNESLITKARNKIFSYFIDNTDFDYLLFLDADICFPRESFLKLVRHDLDIVGAPVRLKSIDKVKLNYGHILDDSKKPLVEVDRIGNAVMLISRKLAQAVKDWAVTNKQTYKINHEYTEGNCVVINNYDVFKCGVFDGEYLSEDYYFCKLVRELGFKVYCDLSCTTVHTGMLRLKFTQNEFTAL